MSLFQSKSKSTTTGTTAPTNPKPVTDSLIDFTKLINSLGTRDPRQFVTGPSNLQNAAFSMGAGIAQRYGIGVPQGQPQGQMQGQPQVNQRPTNYNTPEGQMGGIPPVPQQPEPQKVYGSPPPGQMGGKPQINQLPTNYNTPEGQMGGIPPIPQEAQPQREYSSPPPGQMGVQMGKPQYSSNTAASMYGSPGVTTSLPISGGQSSGGQSTGGLYGQAGIVPEKQYDYQGYLDANPDVMQSYNAKIVTPKEQANLRAVGADYDNNGQVNAEEFARYHYERHGKGEGRALTQLGGQMGGGQAPQDGGGFQGGQGGQGFGGGPYAAPEIGYTAAQMGQNPNDVYRDATEMARGVGMAGPNRGQLASLGRANTYGASGPANVGGYNASGPANVGGYNASGPAQASGYNVTDAGSQGYTAAGAANVGGYNASRASAQGYNAQDAGSRGYDAATIGEAERVRMGAASNASASRGSQFSQPYENRYTDSVVNTTLGNMDEMSGRQRAQEAADAARNNAFGGSRFGVQRAITEEQIARERASQEAGLRFGAQDRAFGLGMQDAGTASQVSQSNAAAANQMAQAQAMMDQQRLMANMDARNQAGQFGAAAGNQAAMFNAGSQNTARQFGAGAQNQANMFNAQAADAAGQFGAQARNQAQMDAVGRQDAAGQFGAQAANVAGLSNQAARNQAGMFGADAANRSALDFSGRSDTAGQFGADARNRAAMDFTGRTDQAGQFGANARNQAQMDFAGRQDTAGQFNAGAQNQFDLSRFGAANNMSQFNAGMDESSLMRALAASGQMGQLAGAQGTNERADLAMLSQLGNDERAINQAGATADLSLMQMMANLYGTMPYNLFTGQNTTGTNTVKDTPSTMSSIQQTLDVGSSLAGMFGGMPTGAPAGRSVAAGGNIGNFSTGNNPRPSDIRLKTDIEPAGERNGHAWYSYRYVWDEPGTVRSGVMAQEVIQTRPDAVITHPLGFLMVDYAALGLEAI
jgi:hypothetical protein